MRKIIQINFDAFTRYDERVIIKFNIMDVERKIIEKKIMKSIMLTLKQPRINIIIMKK